MAFSKFSDMFLPGEPMEIVMPELLADRTTRKNIVWATDTYEQYGSYYKKEKQMFPDFNLNLILDNKMLPRIQKTKEQQQSRTKARAEVYTPSWVCNLMNNYLDSDWFGREGVFNTENPDHTWTVTEGNIEFPESTGKRFKKWQRYVDSRRIEITCGEAPYLVSRYDATTGEELPIRKRIGILDRKLRVVGENTESKDEWMKWSTRAYEATYGFEYQGDNLFFARVNLVQTFIDYYTERFKEVPEHKDIRCIANIVSWNLWQMDGLKDVVPYTMPENQQMKFNMEPTNFGVKAEEPPKQIYCKIRDWRAKKTVEYRSLKEKRK